MSNEINIQIINTCQLDCVWCGKHWHDEISKRYMGFNLFRESVNKCIDYGIDTFCLTPMHGEITTDTFLIEKLLYLENNDQIVHYFFATNLLDMNIINQFYDFEKLHLEISLYGDTPESYLKHTNRDYFDMFMENLMSFVTQDHTFTSTIYVRFPYKPNSRMKTLLSLAKKRGIEVSYEETHNYNWGGLIPEGSLETEHPPRVKSGVCPTASTGCIYENGDVGLCYMNDIDRTFIFGNIKDETLGDIFQSDKYKDILENMSNNVYTGICENCNERF